MTDPKIALLMEETGCDQEQAQQALEQCGYELAEAVKALARLMRHIVVLKAKFAFPEQDQFGLFMVVLNVKTGALVRAPAVLSYNPAVYAVPLEEDWFEFEKRLYGCRLWEGSIPAESLEIERSLSDHFRRADASALAVQARDDAPDLTGELSGLLRRLFKTDRVPLKLRKDVLDLGQFQSLSQKPKPQREKRPSAPAQDQLILKIELEQERAGMSAREMRAGDMVSARIVDERDIGQYLAKLFGGYSEEGPVPILAPVEAVESEGGQMLVRVRFSVGVCGDAKVPLDSRLKVVRIAVRNQETHSWWKRFFKP